MSAIVSYFPRPDFVPREEMQLANRIAEITTEFERPKLRVVDGNEVVVERDERYWRRMRHDELNRQRALTCRCCKGTGEMWVYIDEPAEPCVRCQIANPYLPKQDERPF